MAESTVAAGTYTLTVDDQASIHNFHFTGDGVDVVHRRLRDGREDASR